MLRLEGQLSMHRVRPRAVARDSSMSCHFRSYSKCWRAGGSSSRLLTPTELEEYIANHGHRIGRHISTSSLRPIRAGRTRTPVAHLHSSIAIIVRQTSRAPPEPRPLYPLGSPPRKEKERPTADPSTDETNPLRQGWQILNTSC